MSGFLPIPASRFAALEATDFQRLEHAPYLKGLLKPFKGKGSLEAWASQCIALRDELILLARQRILGQTQRAPFNLLPAQLAQQVTGAGTTFLRWRNPDRSSMGVSLWRDLMLQPSTPSSLISDLHAVELQRIVLNMQISLLHTMARQALECASKCADAEAVYQQCVDRRTSPVSPSTHQEFL